jgi:hypothetical protein
MVSVRFHPRAPSSPIAARLDLLGRLSSIHPYNRSRRARARELAAWLAFDSRGVALARRREHVLCLGDSHTGALPRVALRGAWLHQFGIGGATASGIRNPASRTGARELFEARLALAPRWQHLLLALGEVDCGFLIWHRARSRGLEVGAQLRQTLDGYAAFLGEVLELGFRSVSVLSATLPTTTNYRESSENPGLKLRDAIDVTLAERMALTRDYNEALAARCREMELCFFDTSAGQLDPVTGRVRSELLVDGDPHLEPGGYAQVLAETLDTPGAPWRRGRSAAAGA